MHKSDHVAYKRKRDSKSMVSKEYLQNLLRKQGTKNKGNKSQLQTVAIYLGSKPREHYANLKDSSGKNVTDPKTGKPLKEEISDGDTYTFSEIGTSKMVKVVYVSGLILEVGALYKVTGLGYDMRNSNMLLIDEDGDIEALSEEV